ncbi:hypothetical protein FB451DRAFT_1374215 [Mycena latifolia]|nr:hypothetical protein FB451DRAFT_1374215 [Mycena latifolia]
MEYFAMPKIQQKKMEEAVSNIRHTETPQSLTENWHNATERCDHGGLAAVTGALADLRILKIKSAGHRSPERLDEFITSPHLANGSWSHSPVSFAHSRKAIEWLQWLVRKQVNIIHINLFAHEPLEPFNGFSAVRKTDRSTSLSIDKLASIDRLDSSLSHWMVLRKPSANTLLSRQRRTQAPERMYAGNRRCAHVTTRRMKAFVHCFKSIGYCEPLYLLNVHIWDVSYLPKYDIIGAECELL